MPHLRLHLRWRKMRWQVNRVRVHGLRQSFVDSVRREVASKACRPSTKRGVMKEGTEKIRAREQEKPSGISRGILRTLLVLVGIPAALAVTVFISNPSCRGWFQSTCHNGCTSSGANSVTTSSEKSQHSPCNKHVTHVSVRETPSEEIECTETECVRR